MLIAPDSDIYLLKTPFEIDNNNQLTFASKQAQFNYFNSLPKLLMEDATYQRKDNVVRYAGLFDDLISYNYCMYRNNNFSNKWFYAYIKNINFVNPNMTEIELETDVFQTWQFDIVYKRMFVEREHVNNDTRYKHLTDEGLDYGEYINDYQSDFNFGEAKLVMLSTVDPRTGNNSSGGIYNNIYGAGKYYTFKDNGLNYGINKIAEAGKSDGIIGVFLAPSWLVNFDNITFDRNGIGEIPSSSTAVTTSGIAIPLNKMKIDGYTPKNNKLYSYPYCAYVLDNNNGGAVELRLENFKESGDWGSVDLFGALTPGCSIRAIPRNYLGTALVGNYNNNQYGLTIGKFPICSYPVDMYTNWLTQNSVNEAHAFIGAGLQFVGGMASMGLGEPIGGASMIGSSVSSIIGLLGERYRQSLIPDQARGNTNSGDVMYSTGRITLTGIFKTIKREWAERIDNYFSMYGYRINNVKIPNITGRRNWNYVKTINCNILGDIPQGDLQKLKGMFDSGVTLWHNPNTFLDYSQNNSIV